MDPVTTHRCTVTGCPFSFKTAADLLKHMSDFHYHRVCPEEGCGKTFQSCDGLNKHVQTIHRGVRYSCACGQEWSYASNYYQHRATCPMAVGPVTKSRNVMPKFASAGRDKVGDRFDPFDPLSATTSSVSSASTSSRFTDPFAVSTGRGFLSSTASSASASSGRESYSSVAIKDEPKDSYKDKEKEKEKKKNSDSRINPFAVLQSKEAKAKSKGADSSSVSASDLSGALRMPMFEGNF